MWGDRKHRHLQQQRRQARVVSAVRACAAAATATAATVLAPRNPRTAASRPCWCGRSGRQPRPASSGCRSAPPAASAPHPPAVIALKKCCEPANDAWCVGNRACAACTAAPEQKWPAAAARTSADHACRFWYAACCFSRPAARHACAALRCIAPPLCLRPCRPASGYFSIQPRLLQITDANPFPGACRCHVGGGSRRLRRR